MAADSTSAIPKIVTVRKKDIIFSLFPIISIAFSARIPSPIATPKPAKPIAIPIPRKASFENDSWPKIVKATTKPYIAADSTSAINKTMKVIILPFASGFLSIADIAPAINFPSPIPAPRPVRPIAKPTPIEAVKEIASVESVLNATIKP